MTRFLSLALLPVGILGNHLLGPVQDRLDDCEMKMCPGSYEYFSQMAAKDSGLDVKQWLTSTQYVFEEVPKLFPDALVHAECICHKCAALSEAIWQPVGREACLKFGATLPCQAELDACVAAYDLETCAPGHSIFAYKHAYDLSSPEECRAICRNKDGENAPPCNPDDPIIVLNECLATSRTYAGDETISDVAIPCDRANSEKKTCEGIPATKCEALPDCGWNDVPCCYFEGTTTQCDPNGRRLLFGAAARCVCN